MELVQVNEWGLDKGLTGGSLHGLARQAGPAEDRAVCQSPETPTAPRMLASAVPRGRPATVAGDAQNTLTGGNISPLSLQHGCLHPVKQCCAADADDGWGHGDRCGCVCQQCPRDLSALS
jgi:hypothetical protein